MGQVFINKQYDSGGKENWRLVLQQVQRSSLKSDLHKKFNSIKENWSHVKSETLNLLMHLLYPSN